MPHIVHNDQKRSASSAAMQEQGCTSRSKDADAGEADAHSRSVLFFRLILPSLLISALLSVPQAPALEKDTYTVAVVPQFPAVIIKRSWTPLIEQVSQITGLKLKLKFYRSIPEFEDDFLKGVPDFVYLNPYHTLAAVKAQGYVPLVRDGEEQLIGIIVVRRGGPIKSIADLGGKTIAFPSPNAFASSLYLRALLTQKEKIAITPRYVNTHSNVYRHVVWRRAAAGGGVNKTLAKECADLRGQLRVIYETPGIPPHPLCAHPRVAPSVRQAVRAAVLKLAENEEGRELLKAAELSRPVPADYDRDYRGLELLGLDRFAESGN